MVRTNSLAVMLLLVGIAAVAALAAVAAEPASYSSDVEAIFIDRCGDCHSGDDPKKGLDLSKGTGYTSLVNVKSQETGQLLVTPGEPEASYLWAKLTHTNREGKGMPRAIFGSKKLPQAQLDAIRAWIADGARP